jgi:hypothetical protein
MRLQQRGVQRFRYEQDRYQPLEAVHVVAVAIVRDFRTCGQLRDTKRGAGESNARERFVDRDVIFLRE